jgi:hypothetical protein
MAKTDDDGSFEIGDEERENARLWLLRHHTLVNVPQSLLNPTTTHPYMKEPEYCIARSRLSERTKRAALRIAEAEPSSIWHFAQTDLEQSFDFPLRIYAAVRERGFDWSAIRKAIRRFRAAASTFEKVVTGETWGQRYPPPQPLSLHEVWSFLEAVHTGLAVASQERKRTHQKAMAEMGTRFESQAGHTQLRDGLRLLRVTADRALMLLPSGRPEATAQRDLATQLAFSYAKIEDTPPTSRNDKGGSTVKTDFECFCADALALLPPAPPPLDATDRRDATYKIHSVESFATIGAKAFRGKRSVGRKSAKKQV